MSDYPSVLYVEDDARSARIMRTLLVNSMGLRHVAIFEDSADFITRAEALVPAPDVIFLDIHVTPLNGFEMLALLRQHPSFAHLPIIALTASVMNEEIDQLRTAGFNGCFAKPLDMDHFPEQLELVMNGHVFWNVMG